MRRRVRGDELGLGCEQLLVLDQTSSTVRVPTSASCCVPSSAICAARTAEAKDEMLARAACRVDQIWVAGCTAARRASSTWLRALPDRLLGLPRLRINRAAFVERHRHLRSNRGRIIARSF